MTSSVCWDGGAEKWLELALKLEDCDRCGTLGHTGPGLCFNLMIPVLKVFAFEIRKHTTFVFVFPGSPQLRDFELLNRHWKLKIWAFLKTVKVLKLCCFIVP